MDEFRDIESLDEAEKVILESCGYDVGHGVGKRIYESNVAESDKDKIFTIDQFRSYNLEDTANEILKDETFDNYWHQSIYERLDDEGDGALLEQWTPDFMSEEVKAFLAQMKKDEIFYYIDFFRGILGKSENDGAMELIDFNDKAFDEMPRVMRLY